MSDCGCAAHSEPHRLAINAELRKIDPTKTTRLRQDFGARMREEWRGIVRAFEKAVEQGALGDPDQPIRDQLTANRVQHVPVEEAIRRAQQFDFETEAGLTSSFNDWLVRLVNEGILRLTDAQGIEDIDASQVWTAQFVRKAYKRGVGRAQSELRKAGVQPRDLDLDEALAAPVHRDRVQAAYSRTLRNLATITEDTEEAAREALAKTIAEGGDPFDAARRIRDRIEKVGMHRATVLARTEIVRAHHAATMASYRDAGVEGVQVQAEWSTAGDRRVCAQCESLEGRTFSIDEIDGMLPAHPQCRCVALPIPTG